MTIRNITPNADGGSVGIPAEPWTDVVIEGAVKDPTETYASTPQEIREAVDHKDLTSGENPHGTVTAATTDATLTGDGSSGDPLKVAADGHTQTLSTITDAGTAAAVDVPASGDAGAAEAVLGNDSRLTDTRAVQVDSTLTGDGTSGSPLSVADDGHQQTLSTITDAGTAAAYDVAGTGDAGTGEVVKGDDTRLSDSRTPLSHASSHESGDTDPVDHDALLNFVPDEHVAHSGVTVGVTGDLTGGGNIASSMTLGLSDTGVTAGTYTLMGATVDAKGRISSATSAASGIDSIKFNTGVSPAHSEGLLYYDDVNKALAYMNDESDVVMQMGQEIWVRVYNDTGGTITNGQVCYLSGIFSGFPTIAIADASDASKCLATLGFATHDIENSTYGYVTRVGTVRDLNTAGCTPGDSLFLSATTPGAYTATAPVSPNYRINLGNCGVSSATVGTIEVQINIGNNVGGTVAIFNGSILEDHTTTVTSNGTTITLSLEQAGGGDLSLFFNGGFTAFDSTPAATVSLTAGTDTAPALNYIYIPQSTNTLTANTTGFPWTSQIVPIGTVFCQSAATLQTDGPLKHHAWTDHVTSTNGQGHVTHVNRWIREQDATWLSGAALTGTAGSNQFDVATTAGNMLQLHEHPLDVFDTSTGSDLYIVNEFTTKYKKVGNLTQEVTDSAGGSLSGRYYKVVFWVAGNEGSGQDKLYCNFPSGSYNSSSGALLDASDYADYSIPAQFKGTGVLLAALTMRNQSGAGGTFTVEDTADLRGLVPSSAAGAGTGGGGAENFVDLLDVPSSYSGEGGKLLAVNSGETAVEFVDHDGTFVAAASDETTDLTTGTAKLTFRMPYAMTLTGIRASVNTAPTGATVTVDVNESGTTILSTKLTIDANEKTSTTAATPPVISDSALADDAEITVDIDQVGSTIAGKGLKVVFIGTRG